jgi:hypothetical protein
MVNRFLSKRIKVEIFQKERDKMNKEELNEYGYPIHPKSDYSKPPEGNLVSWVGVILVFTEISWGMGKIYKSPILHQTYIHQ